MTHRRRLTLSALFLILAALGCRERQPESRVSSPADSEADLIGTQPDCRDRSPLAGKLAAQLEDAFRSSSRKELVAFLDTWHDSARPVDIEDIDDLLERELYLLFLDFYDPSNLNTIAGGTGYADVVTEIEGSKYIVVQNSLRYRLEEQDADEENTVHEFRPHVVYRKHRVLYLTSPYSEALRMFLETDDVSASVERILFLRTLVLVGPGHWNGWELLTPPTVDCVELDRTKGQAKVSFMIHSGRGITIMTRTANGWRVEETGILYIK
jgi:hypothetical protein